MSSITIPRRLFEQMFDFTTLYRGTAREYLRGDEIVDADSLDFLSNVSAEVAEWARAVRDGKVPTDSNADWFNWLNE